MDPVYASLPGGMEILSCPGDRQFAPHLHDGYVLWLNSEAGEHYRIQGASDILQPGSVSIIEPGVIHDNRPCGAARRHLRSFYFSEQFLARTAAQLSERAVSPVLPTTVIADRQLWQDAASLHQALLQPVPAMQAEEAILSLFARIFESCRLLPAAEAARDDNRRVALAIDYFTANIDRQLALAEVAQLAGCTDFHLIRLFRATKGVSPHTYLVQLRLEHARKLLAAGCPIADAALQSGFADQSHLTRLFKARFGVTPGLYRRHNRH